MENNRGMPALPSAEEESAPQMPSPIFDHSNPGVPGISGSQSEGMEAPIIRRGQGIKVVAIQEGFYQQNRLSPGDEFEIKDMSRLGFWMRCLDPVIQKKHEALQAAAKEKIRSGK